MKPLPPPLIPPERRLPEITIKGLALGIVLAMLMAAANAYLGLRVGMTVAASIPAAAISLGVLRLFRRSNILENNQVQTVASAGASTVSGIIFTVPALVMMGAWPGYDHWTIFAFVVLGGILGVAFTTPLRRALIVDARLAFPEGVATAKVLETGGLERTRDAESAPRTGRGGFALLLQGTALGALFKLLDSGFKLVASNVAAVKSMFGGKWLFMVDAELAPSLLGIGYIVGLNIGVLILMGAVIGTTIGVPINWLLHSERLMATVGIPAGTPQSAFSAEQWEQLAVASWGNCRRIGIGCMIVGGIWSLITLAKPLVRGVRASLAAYRSQRSGGDAAARTELDTPLPFLGIAVAVAIVPCFLLFRHALGEYQHATAIAGLMTVLLLVFGFLFTSVAGYMAGLVGSSNNPVSGVTMATVIVASLTLVNLMGGGELAARVGPPAVIFLAAVICTGACIAGDNLQDLKCGHVVGATPWKQQLCLVLGSIGSALVIPIVLGLLDQDQGIGRAVQEGVRPLAAPQATLMKEIATGIFGTGIDWGYIYFGCGLAVLLIALDKLQEIRSSSFRFPVLAVAVGIYLPFGLSVLIFVGSVLSWVVLRGVRERPEGVRQQVENDGTLLASGLITGEAVMAVLIAVVAVRWPDSLPKEGWAYAPWASLALIAVMATVLAHRK
jgi:putative OPT family oligopeptide transporter